MCWQEASQRAKSSSLHDVSAAALSLRAKALQALGRSEAITFTGAEKITKGMSLWGFPVPHSEQEVAQTLGEASQLLQLAGGNADPKLARWPALAN